MNDDYKTILKSGEVNTPWSKDTKKTFFYPPKDFCIGASIESNLYWESWMYPYIQSAYRPNTNMVDIGAFIGTTTMMMTDILSKKNCKVFVFEPVYHEIVKINIEANHQKSFAEVFSCGLSNTCHFLEAESMDLSSRHNFGATTLIEKDIYSPDVLPEEYQSSMISIQRLDDFSLSNISVIKMDVEHMEISVLEGALETIQNCKPTILLECYQIENLLNSEVYIELQKKENGGYTIEVIPEGHHDYILRPTAVGHLLESYM